MPPRPISIAIILFWLGTTGALVYQELEPRFRAGEPPPFTIPLTADVGENIVNWNVLQKGKQIGNGFTRIQRQPDRTYEFFARFKMMEKLQTLGEVEDLKVISTYRTTEQGNLVAANAELTCLVDAKLLGKHSVEFSFDGTVKDQQMHPKVVVKLSGAEFQPELVPFPVAESGNMLNPMHLVPKIAGLREGRSWRIPLMDPLQAIPADYRDLVPTKGMVVKELIATVQAEDRDWHGTVEPCFKISYAKSGERPLAATWVRRRDDLVLEQWASYEGFEYNLQRVTE